MRGQAATIAFATSWAVVFAAVSVLVAIVCFGRAAASGEMRGVLAYALAGSVNAALAAVRETRSLAVQVHLRNAPTELMKSMGHGLGYRYPHDHGGWVPVHYLPDSLKGATFYMPKDAGYERHIAERLSGWRRRRDHGGDET